MQRGLNFHTSTTKFTAWLYLTPVVTVEHIGTATKISFDSDGWYTQSTAKAMNSGLKHAGIAGHVNRKQGQFIVTLDGKQYKFNNKLDILLDAGDNKPVSIS